MFRSHSFWKFFFRKWKYWGETPARGCHLQNCIKEIEFGVLNNFPRSHLSRAETLLSRCLSSGVGFCPPLFFCIQPRDIHNVPYLRLWQFSLENFKSAFTHIPILYTKIEWTPKNKTNIILHFHLLCLLSFTLVFSTQGALWENVNFWGQNNSFKHLSEYCFKFFIN